LGITVLAASDMHAHNTFDHPSEVHPIDLKVEMSGDVLNVNIPAASVTHALGIRLHARPQRASHGFSIAE